MTSGNERAIRGTVEPAASCPELSLLQPNTPLMEGDYAGANRLDSMAQGHLMITLRTAIVIYGHVMPSRGFTRAVVYHAASHYNSLGYSPGVDARIQTAAPEWAVAARSP